MYQESRLTAFSSKRKKINEIKAKSRIHCQGRAGEEGGGADPRSNGKQTSCGLKSYKAGPGIFDWVGYNTLIRKTESKLELK